MEFLSDDYFLGKIYSDEDGRSRIYPIWLERLQDLFPNRITTKSSFVILKGAIGVGKSTFSEVSIAYDICKLLLMKDPSSFFGLINQSGIHFKFLNVWKYKAQAMADSVRDVLFNGRSPFFAEHVKNPESVLHNLVLSPISKIEHIISDDLLSVVLSEINFIKEDRVDGIINQSISRITSRFQKAEGFVSHIFLDSSDNETHSATERFLESSPYSSRSVCYSTAIWEAKPWLYPKELGTFKVYAGDAERKAIILEDSDKEYLGTLDPDRILVVPNSLKDEFTADIYTALKQKAGISVISGSQFFNPNLLKKVMTLDKPYKSIIVIDFFDDSKLLDHEGLKEIVDNLPKDRWMFARIDLGLSKDFAGIAVGYIEDYSEKVFNGEVIKDCNFRIPIAFCLSRIMGQETSIFKIRDFLLEIHNTRPIKTFTTDQYQSSQIRQELTKSEIESSIISVDKTTEPYIVSKNMIYQGRVLLPNNKFLFEEGINLMNKDKKVDHPMGVNPRTNLPHGKDTFDAVSGLIFQMCKEDSSAMDPPIVNQTLITAEYSNIIKDWSQNHLMKRLHQRTFGERYGSHEEFS
jgi:hypothetical protein